MFNPFLKKGDKCICHNCINRTNPVCGRYPDFCDSKHVDYDEDFYTDCENCDGGCYTILCEYYEEGEE